MKLKKISLGKISNLLKESEMKLVVGGYSGGKWCCPTSSTGSQNCVSEFCNSNSDCSIHGSSWVCSN